MICRSRGVRHFSPSLHDMLLTFGKVKVRDGRFRVSLWMGSLISPFGSPGKSQSTLGTVEMDHSSVCLAKPYCT